MAGGKTGVKLKSTSFVPKSNPKLLSPYGTDKRIAYTPLASGLSRRQNYSF
jgi:hypothetical protein